MLAVCIAIYVYNKDIIPFVVYVIVVYSYMIDHWDLVKKWKKWE